MRPSLVLGATAFGLDGFIERPWREQAHKWKKDAVFHTRHAGGARQGDDGQVVSKAPEPREVPALGAGSQGRMPHAA